MERIKGLITDFIDSFLPGSVRIMDLDRKEILILALLHNAGLSGLTGLQIVGLVDNRRIISRGTVYIYLTRLIDEGLVDKRQLPEEVGYPRYSYFITKKGVNLIELILSVR